MMVLLAAFALALQCSTNWAIKKLIIFISSFCLFLFQVKKTITCDQVLVLSLFFQQIGLFQIYKSSRHSYLTTAASVNAEAMRSVKSRWSPKNFRAELVIA